MKKRELSCALIAGAAMLDVIGLVGSVDVGTMSMRECIPKAIMALIVAVIAVVIGESTPEEKEKKEAAPDGNHQEAAQDNIV